MSLIFLILKANGAYVKCYYDWLIALFLIDLDIIAILLVLIAVFTIRRWNKIWK